MNSYVFVYGSLMRGRSNHDIIKDGYFLGRAVVQGVGLYDVTPYYPGAVRERDKMVRGEVYEVDAATLKTLDWVEVNGNLYRREIFNAYLQERGDKVEVWVYLWLQEIDPKKEVPLEAQPWQERDPGGEEG
ncbi:MAG: gamma-glutamylcyclotransferase [Candidatus Syntrophonatronum acetioxidans]|uniref:Gamma-glutamylcyclotransferase family protein n=1 Tax=Candidatus Syntrophonatronum acetioxidans TaxID=1795816 RepID=A0A424YBB8_9FIRM|nr:MAG: gamma-glutamylcyclotransferase [Candidatus Syntrophonatronum acetioxidans]